MSGYACVESRVDALSVVCDPNVDARVETSDIACDAFVDKPDIVCDASVQTSDIACDAFVEKSDIVCDSEVDARVDALGIVCEEKIELDVDSDGEASEPAWRTNVGPEEGEWASLVDHEFDVNCTEDLEMPAMSELAQASAVSDSPAIFLGPRTPPHDGGCDALVLERLNDLQGRYVQLKDVVDRLEMIFNQSVGRLDDQINAQVAHSKRNTAAVFEIRGVIQALVAEVGEEDVKARIQAMQQQSAVRQHELFGGGGFSSRARGPQRYPDQNSVGGWNRQPRDEGEVGFAYHNGGEQWKRKGRGGGRRNY